MFCLKICIDREKLKEVAQINIPRLHLEIEFEDTEVAAKTRKIRKQTRPWPKDKQSTHNTTLRTQARVARTLRKLG